MTDTITTGHTPPEDDRREQADPANWWRTSGVLPRLNRGRHRPGARTPSVELVTPVIEIGWNVTFAEASASSSSTAWGPASRGRGGGLQRRKRLW